MKDMKVFNPPKKINDAKTYSQFFYPIKPNKHIVVYFSGTQELLYQLQQWMDVFIEVDKKHPVLIIMRHQTTKLKFQNDNRLPSLHFLTLTELLECYNKNEFPLILYVNNNQKNFQSLIYNKALHIHLNHGESEKESMRSNQAKAYDYVFTVGKRGTQRYQQNLLNFNPEHFIEVGRPQLDFIEPLIFDKEDKTVILYAPTWEATHSSMNYTSLKKYGLPLVLQLLKNPNFHLIYRPHSSTGTVDAEIKKIHQQILSLVNKSPNATLMMQEEINSIFTIIDFAFFDNSSVLIDYLHHNKPACYLEILELEEIQYLKKAYTTIHQDNFSQIPDIINDEISNDPNKQQRDSVKELYLGNYEKNESTAKFISTLQRLIE
jgi:CDP-glycerol glycerophosphotransferase (TagB/SpsB family)